MTYAFDDNWYSVEEIVGYYIVELKHTIEKSLNKAYDKRAPGGGFGE
jgi:hypothetical protein